jgi:hypothetical protein
MHRSLLWPAVNMPSRRTALPAQWRSLSLTMRIRVLGWPPFRDDDRPTTAPKRRRIRSLLAKNRIFWLSRQEAHEPKSWPASNDCLFDEGYLYMGFNGKSCDGAVANSFGEFSTARYSSSNRFLTISVKAPPQGLRQTTERPSPDNTGHTRLTPSAALMRAVQS